MHPELTSPRSVHDSIEQEAARVARHLREAELSCRARSPDLSSPATQLLRTLLLDELAEYRAEGRFPRHHDSGVATPVFVDASGTHCAVGHLLAVTGAEALVARVASRRNLARVRELVDEQQLVAWLAAVGLSVDEAARIQPTYCSTPAQDLCSECVWGDWGHPADAVDGHIDSYENASVAIVVVDAIYGSSPELATGTRVRVTITGSASSTHEVGARVVVPVRSELAVDGGVADGDHLGYAIVVSPAGVVACGGDRGTSVETYATARTATDCVTALSASEPRLAHSACSDGLGCGCSTAGASRGSVDLLLVAVPILVGLAIARRRLARSAAGRTNGSRPDRLA